MSRYRHWHRYKEFSHWCSVLGTHRLLEDNQIRRRERQTSPLILLEQREDDQSSMHLIMPVMTIRKQQNDDLDRDLDQQREEERRSRDTLLKMPVTFVKLHDRNVRHLPLTQDTNGSHIMIWTHHWIQELNYHLLQIRLSC